MQIILHCTPPEVSNHAHSLRLHASVVTQHLFRLIAIISSGLPH